MNKKKKSKKANNKIKTTIKMVSPTQVKAINVKGIKEIPVKHDYLSLPVEHIKSDMLGMVLFSLIAVCSIFLLKRYNVSLEMILSYLASLR